MLRWRNENKREKNKEKKKCENKIEKSDFPTNANIHIILHGNSIYGSLIQQYTQKNQFEMKKTESNRCAYAQIKRL